MMTTTLDEMRVHKRQASSIFVNLFRRSVVNPGLSPIDDCEGNPLVQLMDAEAEGILGPSKRSHETVEGGLSTGQKQTNFSRDTRLVGGSVVSAAAATYVGVRQLH